MADQLAMCPRCGRRVRKNTLGGLWLHYDRPPRKLRDGTLDPQGRLCPGGGTRSIEDAEECDG